MASTVWRGYIAFGLISIPVRLFKAARPERIPLRRVVRTKEVRESNSDEEPEARDDGPLLNGRPQTLGKQPAATGPLSVAEPLLSPVRQILVSAAANGKLKDTGSTLQASSVLKGYEFEKNRFVEIDRETLKNIAPKTSTEMQIQEFVGLGEVDPVFLETSYYVVPEEAAERSYALLYTALKKTELVALAQFAMHGREHLVMVRPGSKGLLAHTMFYASEVRGDEEFRAQQDLVVQKELDLAEMLVQSLTAAFEPEKYKDSYREKLEALISEKVRQLEESKPHTAVRKPAAVVDIAEALRNSLSILQAKSPGKQESRKPATREPKAGQGRQKVKGAT